jgi:seryl-tRNA synthetase
MPGFEDGTIVQDGIARLGPMATRLMSAVDGVFAAWGERVGALAITPPPLLTVGELTTLDVYQNFPHLSMVATTIEPDQLSDFRPAFIGRDALQDARMALPSAVCYSFYLHLRGRRLVGGDMLKLTGVGTCYRNEDHFDGLRRLRAFRMREVVALGEPDQVRQHLAQFTALITRFTAAVGLQTERQAASDPFFDPDSPQAKWQLADPVKYEFQVGDLAIASVNEHHKFFGDRCAISLDDGATVSTGCAAFGLERWLHALGERYDADWPAALAAVEAAGAESLADLPPADQARWPELS